MNHGQHLRDLLEPLGVYPLGGLVPVGRIAERGRSAGRCGRCAGQLTAGNEPDHGPGRGPGPGAGAAGRERDQEDPESLRETLAALLRIGNGAFTLAAMNDALRGCGIPGGGGRDGDKTGGGGVLSGGRGGAGGLRKAEGTGGGHPALPPSGGVSLCGNNRRRFVRGLCAGR